MSWTALVGLSLVMISLGSYWHAKKITRLEKRVTRLEDYVLRLRQVCKPYAVDKALEEIIAELEKGRKS